MDQTYRLIVEPTVQAAQVTPDSIEWLADWCRGRKATVFDQLEKVEKVVGVNVVTQHGVKLAPWNYFVARKLSGDFKVYDPTYFFSKYARMVMCWACSTQSCDQATGVRGCLCCHKKHGQ